VTEWGPLDAVIYSAGQWEQATAINFEAEAATRQANVNYLGLMRVVGAVMPDMIARRGGTIVGMASLAGYAGVPSGAAYCSSKSGVLTFLQTMRIELKQYDVEVVTLAPGYVKTAMTENNTFDMPFLMEVEDAADEIMKGLARGNAEVHFPKRFSRFWKFWTALPRGYYESWMVGQIKKGKYPSTTDRLS
jgi:short-subunit dehydrogenase